MSEIFDISSGSTRASNEEIWTPDVASLSVSTPDVESPEFDLLDERVLNEQPHEVVTAPLITRDAYDHGKGLAKAVPQYGVIGSILSVHSHDAIEFHGDPRLYLNTNAPFSAVVCGVQGSGKSHTVGVLLEAMMISGDKRLGTLNKQLSGLVLHYGENGGSQVCEAAYQCLATDTRVQLPAVKVYVSPSQITTMKKLYAGVFGNRVEVIPLKFAHCELDAQAFLSMMCVNSGAEPPLYVQIILSLLREMGEKFTYAKFKTKLEAEKKSFNPMQLSGLQQRMALLEGFLQPHLAAARFRRGRITIVDLTDPFIDPASACSIFEIVTRLFVRSDVGTGKVLVLDEAHKYLTIAKGAQEFTKSLLSIVRQQRHLGMRMILSTQEPTVIPPVLLDLCTVTIMHRFSSLGWFDHLAKHVSSDFNGDAFDAVVRLQTGQAIVLAPGGLGMFSQIGEKKHSNKDYENFGRRWLLVKTRRRVTKDDIPQAKPSTPPRLTAATLNHPMFKRAAASRLDLSHWISGQTLNARLYATQGNDYLALWKQMDAPEQDNILEGLRINGETKLTEEGRMGGAFASPILQPRARTFPPKAQTAEKTVKREHQTSREVANQANCMPLTNDKTIRTSKQSNTEHAKGKQGGSAVPTQDKENDSIELHDRNELRLAERRERRRAKRDILRPPKSVSESLKSASSRSSNQTPNASHLSSYETKAHPKKTKRKKKARAIPGIALMEQFSAKNVGQDRLTMRPSASTAGYFSRGKSSSAGKLLPSLVKNHSLSLGQKSMTDFVFSELTSRQPPSKAKTKKRSPSASPAKSALRRGSHKRRLVRKVVHYDESSSVSEVDEVTAPEKNKIESSKRASHDREEDRSARPRGEKTKKLATTAHLTARATKSKRPKRRSRSADDSLTSASSLASATSICFSDCPNQGKTRQESADPMHNRTRYLSPPWVIDGEVIGDVVEESDQKQQDTLRDANPLPLTPNPDVVLDLRSSWKLGEARAIPEPAIGSSQEVQGEGITEDGHSSRGRNPAGDGAEHFVPCQRSRFFSFSPAVNSPERGARSAAIEQTPHTACCDSPINDGMVNVARKEERMSTPLFPPAQDHNNGPRVKRQHEHAKATKLPDICPRPITPFSDTSQHVPPPQPLPTSDHIQMPFFQYPFAVSSSLHASINISSSALHSMQESDPFAYNEAMDTDLQGLHKYTAIDETSLAEELDGANLDDGGFLLVNDLESDEADYTDQRGYTRHRDAQLAHHGFQRFPGNECLVEDDYEDMDNPGIGEYGTNPPYEYPGSCDPLGPEEEEDYYPETERFLDADDSMELYESIGVGGCSTPTPEAAEPRDNGIAEEGTEAEELDTAHRFTEGRALLLGLEAVQDGNAAQVSATFAHWLWRKLLLGVRPEPVDRAFEQRVLQDLDSPPNGHMFSTKVKAEQLAKLEFEAAKPATQSNQSLRRPFLIRSVASCTGNAGASGSLRSRAPVDTLKK
ncbi:hypothetical protein FRB97_001966 [Tulasnella sp. 331]|nr:hypothetical protein FRB97_001966 [Tulasnella sp. 331]